MDRDPPHRSKSEERAYGQSYGVLMTSGPLDVKYKELVPEIKEEPKYDAALAAVR